MRDWSLEWYSLNNVAGSGGGGRRNNCKEKGYSTLIISQDFTREPTSFPFGGSIDVINF